MKASRLYFDGVGTVTVSKFSDCVVVYLTPVVPDDPNPDFAFKTRIVLCKDGMKAPELVVEK